MSATSKVGLLAECGALMSLSTIAVSLRIYARTSQRVSLGPDDWTALLGVVGHLLSGQHRTFCIDVVGLLQITFLALSAIAIRREWRDQCVEAFRKSNSVLVAVLKSYSDYDSDSLTPEQVLARVKPEAQLAIAYDFMSMTTLACAKLSALFFYLRIFNGPLYSTFSITIKVTVGAIAAWYVTFNVLSCLPCRSHFSAFWDGNFEKYCGDLNLVWAQGLAISDFILDLWVLLLPIPLIIRLHASRARKLSIIGVFLLAFVGLGASLTRIVVFFLDTTPGGETLFIGVLEAGTTITAVNLPSLWHLCTSQIPSQIVISLRSVRSLGSGSSHDRDPTEEIDLVPVGEAKLERGRSNDEW